MEMEGAGNNLTKVAAEDPCASGSRLASRPWRSPDGLQKPFYDALRRQEEGGLHHKMPLSAVFAFCLRNYYFGVVVLS
jgi:hypothetical protein